MAETTQNCEQKPKKDFEKDLFVLMNNSDFGKTTEDVRNTETSKL